jgi:hypothetical protein
MHSWLQGLGLPRLLHTIEAPSPYSPVKPPNLNSVYLSLPPMAQPLISSAALHLFPSLLVMPSSHTTGATLPRSSESCLTWKPRTAPWQST